MRLSGDPPPLGRPRILRQDWRDLSFLHWAVDPTRVAHYFPSGTRPDEYDGRTYVGVVPFRMVDVGLSYGPTVLSFLETNVRLYSVDSTGRRGVVFLSMDANNALVVAAARTVFGLPYRLARMRYEQRDDLRSYATSLRSGVSASITTKVGGLLEPGPLEHFLTARWGLHVARAGRTWYLPNEHPPWVLRSAELALFEDNGVLASVGLGELAARPPDHLAFSDGVHATFGLPRR